jgi:hypothetical protein
MGAKSATLAHPETKQAKQPARQSPRASAAAQASLPQREFAAPGGTAIPRSLAGIPPLAPGEISPPPFAHPSLRLPLQRKLAIGAVNDPLESEADAIAAGVMGMAPKAQASVGSATPVLRRKCSCGGEKCDKCKQEQEGKVQRKAAASVTPREAPPIVHETLRSPGQPLDSSTRSFFEPRFKGDFSSVRVHADDKAAESARAVNALAYTVGPHLVFGPGQYAPSAPAGRELLAHELAHVMQQKDLDSATPRLNRKVAVEQPKDNIKNPSGAGLVQTNAKTIENYLQTICPGGSVAVDANSGNVAVGTSFCTAPALPAGFIGPPDLAPAQKSTTPSGCGCLCDLVSSTHSWRILVDDDKWPHTEFDDHEAAVGKKPGGTGGRVTAPSPNSTKLWGAGTAAGAQLNIDPWLVLGHELCGHGWLGDSGKHAPDEVSPRGEGGHQETVARENLLRAEHGIDLRGTFKDPDCGESFSRDKAAPGTVNWSGFHSVCVAWRNSYNAAHGTHFKITDKIP